MTSTPTIRRIELIEFTIEVPHVSTDRAGSGVHFTKDRSTPQTRFAVRMETNAGITGEYVPPRGRARMVMRAVEFLAPRLLGANALERERLYRNLRQATKHVGEIGIGPLDIALWDIAGKLADQPVFRLLGGHRTALPAYASTLHGDREAGGLDSPGAYAEFLLQCESMGYRAFKTHGWSRADVREESALLEAIAVAGEGRVTLMHDAGCHLATFHDAVRVGQVCDEHGFFWYEDPFADGGVSTFAHQRLKQFVRTPLLMTEHVHTPEVCTDMLVAGATDFARCDPDYDCGITGSMKIANAADALGMDTEVHACGPAMRQVMAALAKSNYYEVNLVHPTIGNAWALPVYACDYSDDLDCVDADGNVSVSELPGLGVRYDWDRINASTTDRVVID